MADRDSEFRALWDRAHAAGMAAGLAVVPDPMVLRGSDIRINGVPISGKSYFVADGPCGFAWVRMPGNKPLGRWAKKNGLADSAYPTGVSRWVHEFRQSITRKEAYAEAFAAVLREAGYEAWAGSRLD